MIADARTRNEDAETEVARSYPGYLASLLAGDYEGCAKVTRELLDGGSSIRDIYEHLFGRSLQEVGRLWETNQISVAREHLTTALTERLMALVAPEIFSGEHIDRTAIVACSANELHQVGGRMVADTLEMNRWHAFFLGADTPLDDLISMIREKSPDLLALSVAIPWNLPVVEEAIRRIRGDYPELPILLGGQAFRRGGGDIPERYEDVTLLDTLEELESYLKTC